MGNRLSMILGVISMIRLRDIKSFQDTTSAGLRDLTRFKKGTLRHLAASRHSQDKACGHFLNFRQSYPK
jgi:hypothetical protein